MRRRTPAALAIVTVAAAVGLSGLLPVVPTAGAAVTGSGFVLVDDFDDRRNGSLREQGPWQVNVPGSADGALASDLVPPDFSGKALLNDLDGSGGAVRYRGNTYASLGAAAVPSGSVGTVFFEVATAAPDRTALHLGLSADSSPGLGLDTTGDPLDLDDFGPQVSVDRRGLVARDGARDVPLTGLAVRAAVRYRVWLLVDNDAHRFSVRAQVPGGRPVTLASAAGQTSFGFRSSPDAPLVTFLHLNDPVAVPTSDSWLDSLHVAPGSHELGDPSPQLGLVTDFDTLPTGPVDGRDSWRATGASIAAGPDRADGRVLRLGPGTQSAARPLPAVAPGGTLFFRMRREGAANASFGATDDPGRRAFDDFRLQTGATGGSAQVVRDAGAFETVGSWDDRAWRCVWLVLDDDGDAFTAYARGGDLRTTTRLRSSDGDTFGLRRTPAGALDSFLAVVAGRGVVQVDHLAVDPAQRDLRTPAGAACPGRRGGPVRSPAPADAQPARLELTLARHAQLPPAAAGSPARRANAVVPLGTTPGRLAVPTLEGQVLVMRSGRVGTYLDVAARTPDFVDSPGLGTGLGYVAFAPDFDTSGRLYTVHTEAGDALVSREPSLDSPADARVHGVVTEWTATDPAADVFSGSRREVLRIGFSRFTHGIQQIDFAPHARPGSPDRGLLYIGVGDGDETPYFSGRPGDLGAPQGKLLRIDPRASGSAPYTVPRSNPYVGVAGALPEVWASGLRNPHRFGWDPRTGRMLLGNIGEKQVDAVYEVRPGDDFGWNRREGAYVFDPDDPTEVFPLPQHDTSGVTYPVLQLGRGAGRSLVVGPTYRGRLAALRGRFLFGDIVDGRIREVSSGTLGRDLPEPAFHDVALRVDGRRTTLAALARGRVDLRLGRDGAGEVYVLSKSLGTVWRVSAARSLVPPRPTCFTGPRRAAPRGARGWSPLDRRLWSFRGTQARLVRPGPRPAGPTRPWAYATVRGVRAGSFDLRARVRVDRRGPAAERDVVLLLGHRSHRRFSYVHLSDDPGTYAHNGVFVVDGVHDRTRVDDRLDGVRPLRPSIDDHDWHRVRVVHCAGTSTVYVYVDDLRVPFMTATDDRFGSGRVGFGSFNDVGRIDDVRIRYAPGS